ncbi:heavy metal translocating P-type ATPase [Phreatobacter oligotrophus]|uniref:P-type Zn(2+) transporter n=1 Tax=Phreatobacter oligotrophus TaxID=1122261 RepID=A0A2T4YWD2_9HYPH|nr:heavy metal translocating P-type ATPase [Phreatobacter oligotrophus]MBY0361966.1 cadmium-translocating P-type ATPase [Phreatobacter sp.]PTM48250.1 Cd2+/Zn2+-exporting ATPase [Phreatobacter oligotrophus]
MTPTRATERFRVVGMDCASCAAKIETAVGRLSGVGHVSVSVMSGTLSVTHDGSLAPDAIALQVQSLGYSISPTGAADEGVKVYDVNDEASHTPGRVIRAHSHSGDRTPADQPGKRQVHDHAGHTHQDLDDGPWWRSRKAMLTIGCGAALAGAWIVGQLVPAVGHWVFALAMAVGLVPIARRAVMAAAAGMPFTIETLMTIAAVGAVFIGATEEAAAVVFLFLVGELLEGVAASRARASIKSLTALVPQSALVDEGGITRELPADTLQPGMMLLVRPGDRIAADGEIVGGESSVDEAPVTGESTPNHKQPRDAVFAGTINIDAVLRVKVTATAEDNTIARVVKLVEEAQESKAPTERFIDQFSRYYTPGVLVVGALMALVPPLVLDGNWSEWIYKGLAVLLIGCPCALVISTPAAIAAGLAVGARRGLLMKGGAVLEGLRKVTTVALDKTGTLTEGKPVVTDVVSFSRPEAEVLSLAAALETGSSHPLAVAILARAKADALSVPSATDARAISGKGVVGRVNGQSLFLASPKAAQEKASLSRELEAVVSAFNDQGKTVTLLLIDDRIVGLLAIRDEPREDAAAGLKALADAGIATVMLTGDNERTARAIGNNLGIAVRAGLLPEDKQRIVREMQRNGQVVAKVGDGINDAPALAAADIGIAMGGGTDVALETADAAVLHGRVRDIANMVELSRRVMNNIGQNIVMALGLKAVFLVTTVAGITGLWPAILADTGATVLVTANAVRLLGTRLS